MQYQKTIFENQAIKLMINFSGISNDIATAENMKLHFYAFNKLNFRQVFEETLSLEQIRILYNHLNEISIIKDAAKSVSGKFVETTQEILELIQHVGTIDIEFLSTIINKLDGKNKIQTLLNALSDADLENLTAAHNQQSHRTELEHLKRLLNLEHSSNIVKEIGKHKDLTKYSAGQPEKIFQNWVENNLWVFGVEYIQKHDVRKIAIFSEGDLLMESIDGFLDLIELKRPKLTFDIFKYDNSHKSYYPSPDLSKVIGQCLFYLQKLDEYKLVLEKEHKIKILRPRIKIILGRTKNFNEDQIDALRMLNSNLNHIQIISYDYLLISGSKIIEAYE